MAFYDKLRALRREQGLSQEELAYQVGVSRQAMSKWESGQSYPELDKLIALSDVLGVSIDALVKDIPDTGAAVPAPHGGWGYPWRYAYEYKSKRTLFGMPLVHIHIARGFDLRKAKGIIAIGNRATGIVAVGVFAKGILSFGVGSMGIISVGVCSLGLLAAGSLAAGVVAIGAIALGVVAMGAVALGMFSVGAVAAASHVAIGDHAIGHVAIGRTASGAKTILDTSPNRDFSGISRQQVRELILGEYPNLWKPIVSFLSVFFW